MPRPIIVETGSASKSKNINEGLRLIIIRLTQSPWAAAIFSSATNRHHPFSTCGSPALSPPLLSRFCVLPSSFPSF